MTLRILTAALAILLLGSVVYAALSYARLSNIKGEFESKDTELAQAQHIHDESPRAFGTGASKLDLKALVQQTSGRTGVSLAYLSEIERDLDEGVREHAVVCRALNVPQAKLVEFLRSLETQGAGAHIKELRLKPSNEHNQEYSEVEAIYAAKTIIPKQQPTLEGNGR